MIARWAPERLRSLDSFNRTMEELFGKEEELRGAWMPTVDVKETEGEIIIRAELPGLKEKDVHVQLDGDLLTLSGKRSFEDEERREDYVRIERSYGRFQRSFTLGLPIKSEEIEAKFKDGLLTITVPKAEGRAPKRIAVTA
jgi:HSP20 family protein